MDEKVPEDVRQHSEFVKKYYWLIRPCKDYNEEASACKAFKARFHQYFIDGSFTDCSPLLQNSALCLRCTEEYDEGACKEIIKNESVRRLKRIESHSNNDVWEKRKEPPDNWCLPLPKWFLEEKKYSLFDIKKEEFLDFMENSDPKSGFCSIL